MRFDMKADQAEGLRRLLMRKPAQMINLLAARTGVGRTSTAINLATAMACFGKKVMLLDENHAPNNSLDHLGWHARFDLLDAVKKRCKPNEAVWNTKGFSMLSTARAMYSPTRMKPVEQQRLAIAFNEIIGGVDVLLIDTAMPFLMKPSTPRFGHHDAIFKPLVTDQAKNIGENAGVTPNPASGIPLIVMDATASGIIESYALIKRLAVENTLSQFWIVVNKAVDDRTAMTAFGNMAKLAQRNLAARLEYLGYVPCDFRLKRATRLGASVIDIYPASFSSNCYITLAKKLLRLTQQQDEAVGNVGSCVQSLINKISTPPGQARKVADLVGY